MSFTESIPIRKDIDGSPEQVFKYQHFVRSLIASIEAGTIAAIGTVNMGSAYVQYIFNPKVYKDLQGKPTTIVGNSSDTIGEYSLLRVDISCIKNFVYIERQSAFDKSFILGATIPEEFLKYTSWKDEAVPMAATILPNFFPIYFGQKLVYGDLRKEDTRIEFERLGVGYRLWADAADSAIQHFADTSMVIDSFAGDGADDEELDRNFKLYFDSTWDPTTSTKIALNNGPCGTFDIVQSGDYPQEARAIANVFNPAVTETPQLAAPPQTFNVLIPSEVDKEADAQKGITKLMLLHICGDVDVENGTITNIAQANPSKGMECVLAVSRSARAQAYADLLNKACITTASLDPCNIRSFMMSFKIIQKTFASNLIAGNFAREPISSSFWNEANSIDPSLYMPQRNMSKIESIKNSELTHSSELMMDVPDAQKTRQKTAMARIGVLNSVDDFLSTCINMDTLISGTVDETPSSPQPILRQFLMDFVKTVKTPGWKRWFEITGSEMPAIQLMLYGYLESVWIGVATFATDFNNCNVITEKRPLTELHTTGLQMAARAYKAFKEAVLNAQASNAAITHIPIHLRSAMINAAPTTNASDSTATVGKNQEGKSARNTGKQGSAAQNKLRDGNSQTSNASSARGAQAQQDRQDNKRAKRTSRFDTAPPTNIDRGMFYLSNPSIAQCAIFPSNVDLCPLFTCKGKECPNSEEKRCSLGRHPTRADDLDDPEITKIGKHFKEKNVGWFNEYHFSRITLPADLVSLKGNKNGPSSPRTGSNVSTTNQST